MFHYNERNISIFELAIYKNSHHVNCILLILIVSKRRIDQSFHTSFFFITFVLNPQKLFRLSMVCLPLIHLLIILFLCSLCPFPCSTFVSLYVHYFIHQWIFWHWWWLSSLICYCVFTLIHHYCMHHLESELWINYTKNLYRNVL